MSHSSGEVFQAFVDALYSALTPEEGEPNEKVLEIAQKFLKDSKIEEPSSQDAEGACDAVVKLAEKKAKLEELERK